MESMDGSNVEQWTDGDFGVLTDADVRGENNILYTINDGGEPCYVFCSVEDCAKVKYVYMVTS